MINCFCQPIKSDVGCVNGKGWSVPVGSRGGGYVFMFASMCGEQKKMHILVIYVPLTHFLPHDRP